jgi:hypothetical protein
MRKNLSGWNGGEKFPINRDQTPGRECGDSRDESGGFVGFAESVRSPQLVRPLADKIDILGL